MKISRIAIVAGVGIVLAGCSSSATSSSTTKVTPATAGTSGAPTTTTTPASVQSYLLTVSDLPTGWSVDNSSSSSTTSCATNPVSQSASGPKAIIDFNQAGGLPELLDDLAFSTSPVAEFAKVKGALDACKSFTETNNGQTSTGNIGAMSFPAYGDQSASYSATISVDGINAAVGIVLIQKGSYVMAVGLGDLGSFDATQLQQFVTLALAKVPS